MFRAKAPDATESTYARIDPARCGDHKFTFVPGADAWWREAAAVTASLNQALIKRRAGALSK